MKSLFKIQDSRLRLFILICALLFLGGLFSVLTGGVFLHPRNLSNLFRQTTVIAFLSLGMVFVIVARHIDLSVGSIVGFTGTIAALIQTHGFAHFLGMSLSPLMLTLLTILCTLIIGTLIGGIQGCFVAYGNVPSFIVTLAGMLIFRGLILVFTEGRTIGPMTEPFRWIGQAYLPSFLTWVLTGVGVSFFLLWGIKKWKEGEKKGVFFYLFLILMLLWTVVLLSTYHGIPFPFFLLILFATAMHLLSRDLVFGRYVWASGGNPEAAKLSGVPIKKVILKTFLLMGFFSALSGLLLTSRLDAATSNGGNLFELTAIAACVLGGCSLTGGEGSILGALLGALVMSTLDNGMSLLNVEIYWQQVLKGLILLLTVWFDAWNQSRSTH